MPHPGSESQRPDTSTHDLTRRLAITFDRAADALQRSAQLAEEDAERHARRGRANQHATERQVADRAHRAAELARTNAAHLAHKATRDPDVR